MRSAIIIILCLALSVSLPARTARAWETLVQNNADCISSWRSIYEKPLPEGEHCKHREIKPSEAYAEHTRLADMALRELGLYDLFGRNGAAHLDVTDLNLDYFRHDALQGAAVIGDNPKTILGERRIPSPALFAGVPDYSYTIYDWLNKNRLCPPGPEATIGALCHTYFLGWLGNLNSTHFGSQATNMYRRYHTIAMRLAKRAGALNRELHEKGANTEDAYKGFAREAELEALAYEGYAQHYLQDRWAIGHMWERWGAGDYAQTPNKDNTWNTIIGSVAGLLHGSEAVVGEEQTMLGGVVPGDYISAADPLSSPAVKDGKAVPMRWRHASLGTDPVDGVGDDRLTDMIDHEFGAQYYGENYPLNVDEQKKEMLACAKAGWAEVVKAFGDPDGDGKFGAWQAPLTYEPNGLGVLERKTCWDMWATNNSIYEGFVADKFIAMDGVISYGTLARLALKFVFPEGVVKGDPRPDIVRLAYRIDKLHGRDADDPKADTALARGAIGAFMKTKPGSAYKLPDYAEPADLADLPDEDDRGRDKNAVFGAFNRAHSDHFCTVLPDLLRELRGDTDERKQALCEYLADFAYRGTDRSYHGEQSEKRKYHDREVDSICALRGAEGAFVDTPDRDETLSESFPAYIDQGYVSYGEDGGPDTPSERGYSRQSIANWCAAGPILVLAVKQGLRDDNVVAEISHDKQRVTLKGRRLGDQKGVVLYGEKGQPKHPLGTIYTWSDDEIQVDLPAGLLEANTDYELAIATAKGEKSVGLFILRIGPDTVTEPDRLAGVGPCREPFPELSYVDFEASIKAPDKMTRDALKDLQKETKTFIGQSTKLLRREAACIDQRGSKMKERLHIDDGDYAALLPASLKEGEDWDRVYFARAFDSDSHHHFYDVHADALRSAADYIETLDPSIQRIIDLADAGKLMQPDGHYQTLKDMFDKSNIYMRQIDDGLNHWVRLEDKYDRTLIPEFLRFFPYTASLFDEIDSLWTEYEEYNQALSRRLEDGEATEAEIEAADKASIAFQDAMKAEYGECSEYRGAIANELVNAVIFTTGAVLFVNIHDHFHNDEAGAFADPSRFTDAYESRRAYHQWRIANAASVPQKTAISGCHYYNSFLMLARSMYNYDYLYGDDGGLPAQTAPFKKVQFKTPAAQSKNESESVTLRQPQ